jgi:hypothetical protein
MSAAQAGVPDDEGLAFPGVSLFALAVCAQLL